MSAVAGNIEILLDAPFTLWFVEDIALALLMKSTYDISDDYIGLAKSYYGIYQRQRQFYYNNFQTGAYSELGLLNQVFNTPLLPNGLTGAFYTPQYENQRHDINLLATTQIANIEWWERHSQMYGDNYFFTGNDGYGRPLSTGEPYALDYNATIDDYSNYLFRYEEHRKDVYDERSWEWQNQALNVGVKQANLVESGLATSFKFLDTAMNGMADFYSTQANGIASYAGYRKSLAETTKQLSASAEMGRNLAIPTHVGVDVGARNRANGTDSVPSMFMSEEDSMLNDSIRR